MLTNSGLLGLPRKSICRSRLFHSNWIATESGRVHIRKRFGDNMSRIGPGEEHRACVKS